MLGHQLIIDLYECDPVLLNDSARVESIIQTLTEHIHAHIIEMVSYHFDPHGLSTIAQISASHIAVHTWPENQFCALDIFSCTSRIDVEHITKIARQAFQARRSEVTALDRGVGVESEFFEKHKKQTS